MERQGNLKAVLFDFDGTLFELAVDWPQVRRELKELLKFPGPAKEFKPLKPKIQKLTKGQPKLEQQAYDIISRHEVDGAKKGYPHKGAKEILEWCRQQKIKTVILTRNTKDAVLPVIKKYGWPKPDLIVAREDVKKEKPHPEAGLLVLDKLNLKPDECLIVGDSLPDFGMAKNLGIKSVLVENPRHEYLPKDHADFVTKDLLETKGVVEETFFDDGLTKA